MKFIKTFESVSSQKELVLLCNAILKKSSETLEYDMMTNSWCLTEVPMRELDMETDFLNSSSLTSVVWMRNKNSRNDGLNIKGTYKRPIIFMYYTKYEIEDLQKHVEYDSVYTYLLSEYSTHLLHELQHAYDDYISKSKYTNNKIVNKFRKDKKDNFANHDEYLNFQHEINARFSQAIEKIRFFSVDKDEKTRAFIKIPNPFKEVLEHFKLVFDGWDKLSEDNKKRLTQRLFQFWNKKYKI